MSKLLMRHDFHVHTVYSDGSSEPIEMVEAALEDDLEALAITDHGPGLTVGIRRERTDQMIEDVKIAGEDADIPILVGLEANIINKTGELDVGEEVLSKLDLLMAGVHFVENPWIAEEATAREYYECAENAIKRHDLDVLAHPFWYLDDLSGVFSRKEMEDFAEVAAENEVAMELNGKYRVLNEDLLDVFLERGVKFSLGADAHSPGEVGRIDWGLEALEERGVGKESLLAYDLV